MNNAGQERLPLTSPPSRLSGGWFAVKRILLQARCVGKNLVNPMTRFVAGTTELAVVAENRSSLYRESDPAEIRLELGKVQNLRLICRALNGIEVPAGEIFSFWRHIGRCTRRRGYATGRQLQEGCLMPAVGGGICQLTNALYACAVDLNLEIVERHPHTRVVPGASGRDATVAWNDIDLRFRSDRLFRIEAQLTAEELIVRILTKDRQTRKPLRLIDDRKSANSCATCGQDDCHHWHEIDRSDKVGRTAFLVDQWFPELDGFLDDAEKDLLYRPMDGRRWKRPQYGWPTDGFAVVQDFTFVALRRALTQRRLAEQGAARQRALLDGAEELARGYARRLPYDVRHVVVSQTLLPFLWRDGILGGRTFDVLMSRLPMAEIHRRLDAAAAKHPERSLLSDFRAPDQIVLAEAEALAQASRHVTCHAEIARVLPRPLLLDWKRPPAAPWTPGKAIAFPGPTASRKGAYEVRAAAMELGLEVVLLGSELEGADFWLGVKTRRMSRSDNWLEGILAVVQPAVIEDRPIALLKGLESGCPVIATRACGLPPQPGLTEIGVGQPDALVTELRRLMSV
jgi:hypothetical protein